MGICINTMNMNTLVLDESLCSYRRLPPVYEHGTPTILPNIIVTLEVNQGYSYFLGGKIIFVFCAFLFIHVSDLYVYCQKNQHFFSVCKDSFAFVFSTFLSFFCYFFMYCMFALFLPTFKLHFLSASLSTQSFRGLSS